jgi:flagellar FliL protein
MNMKQISRVILTVFLGGIVAVSLIYLSTEFSFTNISLDFSNNLSSRKLPKTPGYHREPIIEFKNRTMVHLGDFTTNIVQKGRPTRFFKTKVSVRTSSEATSEEIKRKNVLIRDAVIETLSDRRFEEVATQQGKQELKQELNERMNGLLEEGEVNEVFFTEFIVL